MALSRWQVEGIERALAAADAGGTVGPHEEVARWLDSWGEEEELPPPRPAGRPVHLARRPLAPADLWRDLAKSCQDT